jgi:hypothetical protein
MRAKFSEYGEVEEAFYVDNSEIYSVEEINLGYHK